MSDALDFAALRERLAGLGGQAYWQGLDDLAQTPQAKALFEAEFPGVAPLLDRRRFLQLMAASLAMAGLAACGRTPEEAVARVEQPEQMVPGNALWYASAIAFCGYAQPVLGKTLAGRPIKLEGNPEHPLSGGTCDAFTQAAILQLYDPDRSQAPRFKGRETAWANVQTRLVEMASALDANAGRGFHIACGASSSPTLARQLGELRQRWPQITLYQAEPFADDARIEASRQAFGRALIPRLHLEQAQVIVSLDDDLLGPGPLQTLHQRGWASRRRAAASGQGSALLYVAQSVPSLTGAAATERLRIAPSRIADLALALARGLNQAPGGDSRLDSAQQAWVAQAVNALKAHPGHGLISAGSHAPIDVHATVARLNQSLNSQAVEYQAPVLLGYADDDRWLTLGELAQSLAAGNVECLMFLDCNPLYTAPAEWALLERMQHVPLRLHAGLYYDESAAQCHWHLPLSHPLDGWSDARSSDGSACIVQPLIEPMYATRTLHQLIGLLLTGNETNALNEVLDSWKQLDAAQWNQALSQGWIGTAAPTVSVPTAQAVNLQLQADSDDLEVVVKPDACVWDGRFANLGWLQELPKPISKLTWSNVVGVSPALAERMGLSNGDALQIELPGQSIKGAAWVEPGQADQVVALYVGYGRSRAGHVGNGLGYWVRPQAPGSSSAVTVQKVDGQFALASTQTHHRLAPNDTPPILSVPRRAATVPVKEAPATLYPSTVDSPALFRPVKGSGPQWGMVIDLDLCTGCNACVVACQAENNIAVVGAEQVANGRAMHWLRIDHYYQGDIEAPRSKFQPLPCMHCEQAPCETGCPVNATVHGSDGLNQMVYNRCIGTRTCASYCPYKVRRFNWFDWSADAAPSIQAQRNPQVTVRGRGVMEKCTYCIQRISAARIDSRIAAGQGGEDHQESTFEVVTACQQTCPSQAIQFGDINAPASAVSQARQSPRHYTLLEELNTRPRTTYLAQIDDRGSDLDRELEHGQ
ncbi:TAT-variant-translocated molybdopterin oxidoreductase [Pseudomonas sp. CCI3.2]|uniref:TAT-variant-translocated molybdopterin oxidoreductase n=1 Tax=unclassified Pseudomonas TaxID=196821 RepID=UPI002AC9BC70|nr:MULTISPECIES: TAT-variant-translocated molybdopterin oxidoreductase [unclassified Pseudomonas]MEB0076439.1 TAT-variant-translocated molybdopterin oxidoreductase [Pseudomonas sp. MH10out]MEB0091212.1 TAT-variant-translocated molybdopterin oxidoreductase [Pseudomonas sp. CCI4.2]MEB0100834.1 TAT-variant-translocated molybdopterin oxidoreductase [Pseudomonas sp. CCI3.2]MEB0128781.1 TAT-variant-translocated molybdopterin oxidoreductase [Pseudomonas sp. CCI2.4]MEB0156992.1 TAT-variant-translocate